MKEFDVLGGFIISLEKGKDSFTHIDKKNKIFSIYQTRSDLEDQYYMLQVYEEKEQLDRSGHQYVYIEKCTIILSYKGSR